MPRRLFRGVALSIGWIVAWAGLCGAQAPLARPAIPEPEPAQIEQWLSELDHDQFQVRESATRQLVDAGVAAVDLITQAGLSDNLEVATRAIQILAGMYRFGDAPTVDAAEASLELILAEAPPAIIHRANLALVLNSDIREDRALAKIQDLGGSVKIAPDPLAGFTVDDGASLNDPPLFAVLGKNWTGGDKGLVYLKRTARVKTLYVPRGTPVSLEAIRDLQAARPDLRVEARGEACLGVQGALGGNGIKGCPISAVEPKSAAQQGGLQAGDVIVSFEDVAVEDFKHLIELIGEKRAGEKVRITVLREVETTLGRKLEPQEKEVTLKYWHESSTEKLPARGQRKP